MAGHLVSAGKKIRDEASVCLLFVFLWAGLGSGRDSIMEEMS